MPYPVAPQEERWKYKYIESFSGGLNSSIDEEKIDDTELVTATNVQLRKGRIEGDTGYRTFGQVLSDIPQATYQFYKSDGTSELLCVGTKFLYYWATEDWHFVKGPAATTLAADFTTGTDITVASSTGFAVDVWVGITLDDGTEFQTYIDSGSHPTWTLHDEIPVGATATTGNVVIVPEEMTGSLDIQPVATIIPGYDWFVFTNGVNPPYRYDGTDCVNVPNLPESGNTLCRAVVLYNNSLILLGTTEGGTAYPQRVRWSDASDPTNWTTGTAGYSDLYDESDFIFAGLNLGPYIIVYRERTIERGEYIGTAGINYNFTPMVRGEGVISSGGIIDIGDFHLLIGNSNFYSYRAGFDLPPVGDNVFYTFFSSGADTDPSQKKRYFGFYVEELDEAWIFYVASGETYPTHMLRYSVADEKFAKRDWVINVVGFGFFQTEGNFTWDSLEGSWEEQTWRWDSRSVLANAPTTHLCGVAPNQVYEYDYLQTTDAGTDISFTIETKDFPAEGDMGRFDMLEGACQGSDILVQYSIDKGQTYYNLGTISNVYKKRFRLFKQFLFNTVRFKFTGTAVGFILGWIGMSYKLESQDGE